MLRGHSSGYSDLGEKPPLAVFGGARYGCPATADIEPAGWSDLQTLLAVWNAGEPLSSLALSNAPWLFGSGKLGTPCERMQRAHRTSAAIFGEGGVEGCAPAGSNAWHAWLADLYVGLLGFRSLPGPASMENATPPPGGVLGSGKSETPWLRIHREYARNFALVDPEPAFPEPFEPPQPAAMSANPSTVVIAAVHRIIIRTKQRFGCVVIGSGCTRHG